MKCAHCHGMGWIPNRQLYLMKDGSHALVREVQCPDCRGTGDSGWDAPDAPADPEDRE